MELKENREIIPPKNGWEEQTYYLADVSFSRSNPVHRAIVAIGFLEDGQPGSYSEIYSNRYDRIYQFREAWYIKIIKKLASTHK